MTALKKSGNSWVRRFHQADDTVTVACFPHAGGSASYYFNLSAALKPQISTVAIQYPGRQDRQREPFAGSLAELADNAYDALRADAPGRLFLFGHSMGSIVAFEVARRFQERTGRAPEHLFASGYPAPSRLRGGSVHRRDDSGIVDELLLVGGTDPTWLQDEDLRALILPAIRNDYRALETHPRRDFALDCPITMLVGDTDPHTTFDEAEAWGNHTAHEFELKVFPGGHFYLDDHPAAIIRTITAMVTQTVH